ncbi:hypothetical protein [Streptomyces lushanensis]|uniref:hypothetical protein n=1 Tax=Streptomyces lushanensis TaxID=1434255 RepID=UPI00114CAFCD|nr:hypothetical protein [Streptomyces lushanensis]
MTTAGVVLAGSLLSVPGVSAAAERPVIGTVEHTVDTAGAAELATGERLELADGKNVGVVPREGRSAGRYAITSMDGALSVRPVDQRRPVATTEVAVGPAARAFSPMTLAAPNATYPVKFTITNANVTTKLVSLWNSKTWTPIEVQNEDFGPNAGAKLSPGSYFAVALHSDWARPSYLLARTFTVTNSGLTVTFDERLAKETAIRTDDTTVAREASAVWISVPGGGLAGFAGRGRDKVYTTPFSVAGASLRVHEILTRKGSSASAPSPVRYDLTHSFQGAPSSPVATVRTASLARTTTPIRAQGVRIPAVLETVPGLGEWTGVYIGGWVKTATTTTEYVTPGIRYSRLLGYGSQRLSLPDRTLAAGTSSGSSVGVAPFGPPPGTGGSTRRATTISLYEPSTASDAVGNSGVDDRAKASFRLTSGGRTLASADGLSPFDQLSAPVPSGTGSYALEHTVTRRVGHSRLSTLVRGEWAFTSPGTSTSRALPLIDTAFTVSGLDARNAAGAAPVTVGVTATTRASEAAETVTALEYSTDDGATWLGLPLTTTGTGAQGSAPLGVPATARFVSLRATAVNDEGGSVRRTLIRAFAGATAKGDEQAGTTKISNLVVNGGKPVVLTNEALQSFTATFTATDPAGVAEGDLYLYHGPYGEPDGVLFGSWPATCTERTATTSVCEATFAYIEPRTGLGRNALAGTWTAAAWAWSKDGKSHTDLTAARAVPVQRHSRLTVDATPEPVKKNATLTVTGALTGADWQSDTGAYAGLGGQSVKLQFRKKDSSTYTTVKTVTSSSTGALRTTVKATADGYWRYYFPGTTAAPPASVTGDHVDVR